MRCSRGKIKMAKKENDENLKKNIFDMFHQNYLKALDIAAEIHSKLKSQVNGNVRDKKLAIYYLQGGCITQGYIAIGGWSIGDLNAPIRAKRFIDEARNLALYFSVLEDDDRHIQKWFQNEIVTAPDFTSKPARVIKQKILKKMEWDENLLKEWQKRGEMITHEFSKGVHPHFESVAYNHDPKTLEFNYKCEQLSFYPIRNFDFANFVIIPAIDSILMNIDILPIVNDDLIRLQEARENIQNIAKQLWNKRNKSGTIKNEQNTT